MSSRALAVADQLDGIIRSADREELLVLLALLEGRRAIVRERLRPYRLPAAKPESADQALTAAAAAIRLKVHEDTVRSLCKRGALRSVRVGKREFRIPESAVIEFLRGGKGR